MENLAQSLQELTKKMKDVKEYVPEFLKAEKPEQKKIDLDKVEVGKPFEHSGEEGLTDYQKEILKEEYGWSDEEIEGIPSWEHAEEKIGEGESEATETENTDKSIDSEENVDTTSEPNEETESEKKGLTDEEKERIKEETGWSDEIINHIESMEQYEIYKNADLHEEEINGRKCLVKDIDLDYVDPKTGMTNRELMAKGRSPIDAKTGEKIELHHMGQDFDAPFAELCENSEHGDGNHSTLHTKTSDSWRNDPELKAQYQREKRDHWQTRANEGGES